MSMDWQTESNMAEMQLMKTKQAMKNMPVKMQTRPVETSPNEMCRAPAEGGQQQRFGGGQQPSWASPRT